MKKLTPVAASVILIILGILLIAWPDASVQTFVRLTAFGLLAVAVVGIAMHAMNKEEKKGTKALKIILFVLYAALGIWILVNPILFEGFYQIVIGIIVAANALKDLMNSWRRVLPDVIDSGVDRIRLWLSQIWLA